MSVRYINRLERLINKLLIVENTGQKSTHTRKKP